MSLLPTRQPAALPAPGCPGARPPLLDEPEAARRVLLLAELKAALAEQGTRSVLARNHRLVLRYNDPPPLEPSGLTNPVCTSSCRTAPSPPPPTAPGTRSAPASSPPAIPQPPPRAYEVTRWPSPRPDSRSRSARRRMRPQNEQPARARPDAKPRQPEPPRRALHDLPGNRVPRDLASATAGA